jgi:putative NADH-flavin reductase
MKIAIFGGTGAIGKHLVQLALEDNHQVSLYVRDRRKVDIKHDNLTITEGTLNEFIKIINFLKEVDVVLSTLGSSMAKDYNEFPVLEGHINIMKAMELNDLKRFITIGTPSLTFDGDQKSVMTVVSPIMGHLIVPRAVRELKSIGHVIKQSALDWTVVRFMVPVNEETGEAKVSFGDKKLNWKISRKNIAAFILKEATENNYVRSMPIVGS